MTFSDDAWIELSYNSSTNASYIANDVITSSNPRFDWSNGGYTDPVDKQTRKHGKTAYVAALAYMVQWFGGRALPAMA